jgi:hypothetical protein
MKNMLIILVISIVLSSCSAESVNNKMDIGNIPGNIKNNGIVAINGEWEYFWAGTTQIYGDTSGGGKLCKMKSDGSNFRVISDDNPCYINVLGDWIYYIKQPRPSYYIGEIYRITVDGKNKRELFKGKCSAMTVVGDWIYFINLSDGNKIYKIKVDGSELTKLIDTRSYGLQYEEGCLYYLTGLPPQNFTLFKFDISNVKQQKLFEKINSYAISDGYIIASNSDNQLFRIKNDGTGYNNLFNKKISSFNVLGNYIYCSGADADYFVKGKGKSCYIYKISLDGKQIITLPNENVVARDFLIGLVNDHVYYWVNRGEWLELARMKNDGTGDEILINRLKANKAQ